MAARRTASEDVGRRRVEERNHAAKRKREELCARERGEPANAGTTGGLRALRIARRASSTVGPTPSSGPRTLLLRHTPAAKRGKHRSEAGTGGGTELLRRTEEVVLLVAVAEALAARDDGHRRLGSVELPVLRRPLFARKGQHARLDGRPLVERRHRVAAVLGLVRLQDLVLIL